MGPDEGLAHVLVVDVPFGDGWLRRNSSFVHSGSTLSIYLAVVHVSRMLERGDVEV